ncbi:RHS repeat-associated core domain-containing protein [Agarilytica rhodophyticola]|uniref:RHS repeat-associated core domain-containing protein n=1 Tax=Agarilytica rhodophyticola TaxID=1737490 RepID=UPI001C1F2BF2|nr:RHS repeat-associated core domain-containing protein [Agarilytica rhodophyticola]
MHITSANLDARYSYTSDGRRLSKTVNGTTTYYLWDGTQLIAEYQNLNNQWQQTRRYDYLPDATTPQQMVDTTGVYTIISDHLDTPSLMLNDQNQVVWRQHATAFGEASIDDDVDGDGTHVTMNFRFPGQYFDQETGTHYNYFRTYDPRLGRYLQSDPIGLQGGINTYAYVGGNPLKYSDPYGLWAHIGIGAGAGAIVNGGAYILTTNNFTWSGLGRQVVIGAGVGAATAAIPWATGAHVLNFGSKAGNTLAGLGGAAAAGTVGSVIDQTLQCQPINYNQALVAGATNAAGFGIGTALAAPAKGLATIKTPPQPGVLWVSPFSGKQFNLFAQPGTQSTSVTTQQFI